MTTPFSKEIEEEDKNIENLEAKIAYMMHTIIDEIYPNKMAHDEKQWILHHKVHDLFEKSHGVTPPQQTNK